MKVTGRIIAINDVISDESPNEQHCRKKTVVVEYNVEDHEQAAIEFFGEDVVKKLEVLKVGDLVVVYFSMYSHYNCANWYTTLKGYELWVHAQQ